MLPVQVLVLLLGTARAGFHKDVFYMTRVTNDKDHASSNCKAVGGTLASLQDILATSTGSILCRRGYVSNHDRPLEPSDSCHGSQQDQQAGSYCLGVLPPDSAIGQMARQCQGIHPAFGHAGVIPVCRANETILQHRQQRRIFFQHFWKAGGTNLNAMAVLNGEVLYHQETQRRLSWAGDISPHHTFIEHPGPMQDTFPLGHPAWMFVTLVREPMHAVISIWLFHWATKLQDAGLLNKQAFLNWLAQPGWKEDLTSDAKEHMDNQMTRWLCGDTCNTRVITQVGYLLAAERLLKFDLVMILEAFDKTDRCMTATLGWTSLQTRPRENAVCAGSNNAVKQPGFFAYLLDDAEVYGELKRLQHWDLKLYEVAKKMAEARRLLYMQPECLASHHAYSQP